ncbi:hypothetical protein DPMN_026466 [Dreissena polymorpha]|uniref:Uncharacterized protein n=1 Tax=Dreissena polymorpha TaxID=45954 RepID=A0A9D4REB6_DREPO|nr:hypothetical protein DPMN_026466 [Dreissena polymorpha]
MTEPTAPDEGHKEASMQELVTNTGTMSIQPRNEIEDPMAPQGAVGRQEHRVLKSPSTVGVPWLQIVLADVSELTGLLWLSFQLDMKGL